MDQPNLAAKPRRLTLKANFSWTFAGNVVNALCQLGISVVLAKLAAEDKSARALGQFGLGLAITAPVMAIAMLQLRNLLVTDARGDYQFAEYFGLRIVWTVMGLLVIAGIVTWKSMAGLEAETAFVVLLVGASKCADSLSDIVRGLFQRLERMDYSGKSLMLRGPSALVAMGVTFWWTENLPLAVSMLVLVWFATLVGYDLRHASRLLSDGHEAMGRSARPTLDRTRAWKLTWTAFPLGIVMSIISLQTNIPRYAIESVNGIDELGYFVALAYPMLATMLIANAMGQSASPQLSRRFIDDLAAFRRLLSRITFLAIGGAIACVLGAWLLGRPFLTIVYGSQYAEHQEAFVILAVAAGIQLVASCGGYALTAARYIRVQVILVGVSCLATAFAAWRLVPEYGIKGAAMSVVVTSCCMLVLFFSSTFWAMFQRAKAMKEASAS